MDCTTIGADKVCRKSVEQTIRKGTLDLLGTIYSCYSQVELLLSQGSHNPFLKAFQLTESGSGFLGLSGIIFST